MQGKQEREELEQYDEEETKKKVKLRVERSESFDNTNEAQKNRSESFENTIKSRENRSDSIMRVKIIAVIHS